MKNGSVIILLSVLSLGSIALAADEKMPPMKVSELPEYDQLRDPFWPIDYVRKIEPKIDPTAPKQPETPVKIEPKWPKLKLKAVTSSPKGFIAIIEGVGLVEAGEVIRKTVDGIVYSWRIDEISEKGFSYKQLNAMPVK